MRNLLFVLLLVLVVTLVSCLPPPDDFDPEPTCLDGVLNGDETDVDCGGSCPSCGEGLNCNMDSDCIVGNVCYSGVCTIMEPPFVSDFSLFVDVDSLNGQCSDSYTRAENSFSSPFCSIQRAADLVEPGDKVRVERGLYEEYVTITRSGTSSDPIVFSGVRDSNGEWLTIIRGGTLASNWVLAPEMDPEGYGVYKTNLDFRPYHMILNNRSLMHVEVENNEWLGYSPTFIRVDPVLFWDGIEGLYGYNDSTQETYIRFRNGDNPNNMEIYATPSRSGIEVRDSSNIIIKNLEVFNMRYGITLTGTNTRNVIIEDNKLINSEHRILIRSGASDTQIRNNLILMKWLSDDYFQGQWGNSKAFNYPNPTLYQLQTQYHLYTSPKALFHRGYAIDLSSGSNHQIYNNSIMDTYTAMSIERVKDVKIYNNFIKNASSVAFGIMPGSENLQIYDNEVYNVNIPFRFQHMQSSYPRSVYIYNNEMSSYPRAGMSTYFHEGICGTNTLNSNNTVWIYHNSYSGYGIGIISGCKIRSDEGLPNVFIVNNVVSALYSIDFGGDWRIGQRLGGVDYNWFLTNPSSAPWLGSNNIIASSTSSWMWDVGDRSFILPANSLARNSGLDLSKEFVLNGRTHQPLPGMEPGYFSGNRPNMGAVQD